MTLFQYIVVLLYIVLSLGVVRLLDGLPAALKPGRRDPLHVTWLFYVFLLHVQYWWVFWSYSVDVAWNYPRFLVVLAAPLLLCSVAITLVPRDSSAVQSWREHFYHVRVRLFSLLACWMLSAVLANMLVLDQPFLSGLRLGQGLFVALCLMGAMSKQPRLHAFLVAFNVALAIWLVGRLFFAPAPLN